MSTVAFAQLFIIHRLLNKNVEAATNVSALFTDGDKQHQKAASKMVQNLKKLGLKRFMTDEYDENQLNTLSLLFTKVIHIYPNDYKMIMSFETNCLPIDQIENTKTKQKDNPNTNNTNNTNNNNLNPRYHESKLFNQSDLVPQAFQFLFFNDINQCCLVNSIWLYHGYNINSIYLVSAHKWLQCEKFKDLKFFNARRRVWQRWINARRFSYYSWRKEVEISNEFLDGFKKLQNVEYINITLAKYNNQREKEFVESICKRGKNYKQFFLNVYLPYCDYDKIDASKLGKLPNINLYNAKEIELSQLLIPISFTNKCEKLTLSQINNITLDWCKYFIKNCDLTNIKRLKLEDFKFSFGMEKNDNNTKQDMMNKIGNKLINLKYFSVEAINNDILTFWKALVPIIKKNNVVLELDTYNFDRHTTDRVCKNKLFDQVLNFIANEFESQWKSIMLDIDMQTKKRSLKLLNLTKIQSNIEKLGIIPFSETSFRWMFSLTRIYTSDDELEIDELTYENINDSIDDDNKDNKNDFDHDLTEKFNKLKILRIPYSIGTFNLATIVDFLQIKFSKNDYFIDIDFDVRFKAIDQSDEDSSLLSSSASSFERNLQTLFNTCMEMIENQIPIDVEIKFKQFYREGYTKENAMANQQSYQKYNDQLFNPLFANNKNIKAAKCNHFCKPLTVPQFEFVLNDSCLNVGDTVRYSVDVAHLTIQSASINESDSLNVQLAQLE